MGSVCVTEADFLTVFGAATSTSEVSSSTSEVIIPDLPDSVIDSGPETITTSTEATFTFHSTKDNSVFSCQIDYDMWVGCESPKTYTELSIGNHQFQVQAMEPTGEAELSPSTYEWQIITATSEVSSSTSEVIVDSTAPVIILLGEPVVDVVVGDSYADAGATATDDTDGDITANIVVANPVDVLTLGTYTVTYNISDAAGNPAVEVQRTVNVVSAPEP